MSVGPLVTEIICTFIVAASILYRYGDWFRHHIIVTLSVLVAWYFSFLIIFILPLDVTSVSLLQFYFRSNVQKQLVFNVLYFSFKQTAYRQCIQEHSIVNNSTNDTSTDNITDIIVILSNSTINCKPPWSYVPENVLPQLWRVLYWTSQFLTW